MFIGGIFMSASLKIACAVPSVRVGDVAKNTEQICDLIDNAATAGINILLFPRLCITGFTCGDLFFQDLLIRKAADALISIAEKTASYPNLTVVVGAPVCVEGKLFDCAAVVSKGKILGYVPAQQADGRWFAPGTQMQTAAYHCFTVDGYTLSVEFDSQLEDCRAPSNADVVVNLSAAKELMGERRRRSDRIKARSMACGVYAYCSAGYTESTQDVVYSGHAAIACNGKMLRETAPQPTTDVFLSCDCTLNQVRVNEVSTPAKTQNDYLNRMPFLPQSPEEKLEQCLAAFQIQVTGLMQRLRLLGAKPVIGVSGGLDSTLALLVAVEAVRRMGRPASDVHGITMPCFGTSDRTYQNAWELMRKLEITCKEINIRDAVTQHFQDIGHDINVHNGTYENSQARERTQILMDYAGMVGGIVVGTGDLSELALGWCTYNGDHMSMYSVNSSVPKTLIRWIIEAVADLPTFAVAKDVLMDILDTPISPELLPPDAEGKIAQKTEDLVGPYELHDFFLYHILHNAYRPAKVLWLAEKAFAGEYDRETLLKWLKNLQKPFRRRPASKPNSQNSRTFSAAASPLLKTDFSHALSRVL